MERIGIRELRQHASVWLKRVQRGDSFEVTDRGRPVALLVPVAEMDQLNRLVASADVISASVDLLEVVHPFPPKPGIPLPSEVLRRMRADER
ncbi:MAG: type II toxin-antitoxin system Phd/YefM family antitoxin [Chloroflexota bacterium]